jgi:hypothetical protein
MPKNDGPFLLMAVLCQRADQDQYGALNVINVLEQLVVGTDAPNAPVEFPGFRLESQLVVSLASGTLRGERLVSIVPVEPTGDTLEPVTNRVQFDGNDHRVTIVANVSLDVAHTGVYWFRVMMNGNELTRIPLRIGYERSRRQPWVNLTPN